MSPTRNPTNGMYVCLCVFVSNVTNSLLFLITKQQIAPSASPTGFCEGVSVTITKFYKQKSAGGMYIATIEENGDISWNDNNAER